MLIVVAIIAILVAIITAKISNSIEKAREATDLANIKVAMEEIEILAISGDAPPSNILKTSDGTTLRTFVKCVSTKEGWQTKGLTMGGSKNTQVVMGNSSIVAPDKTKEYMRVEFNILTGQWTFIRHAASENKKPIFN